MCCDSGDSFGRYQHQVWTDLACHISDSFLGNLSLSIFLLRNRSSVAIQKYADDNNIILSRTLLVDSSFLSLSADSGQLMSS